MQTDTITRRVSGSNLTEEDVVNCLAVSPATHRVPIKGVTRNIFGF